MQTTYRLNTQELSMAFVQSLKSLLPNQEVEIVVSTLPKANYIDEATWLRVASASPSFAFLNDESEAIYTATDGIPMNHEK
jgi:hypothetical protein